ncbi:hypothetical protein A9Z64_01920 [Moraxella osloensis]|uniref:Uncharacterized protein n=1 Tax=Faucicola osloensis TaxID=34062 RepID=A0A0X8K6B0_FAUOS|nr:hypothetical protein [Moraxella osloensis]AME01341.1 hypothetical protein AXE82_05865 [Moraxella osloensis]OBX52062.1 hypothetical protein A9Z64_01920 [Moraxella osloensis]PKZ69316.1 hypothetical protein CYJ96_04090 [Moraxella osloensis]QPT42925.1 hypothetical protein I6G27_02965 [Moraxella osloensis]STY96524.1 Uncharacterised protein [Moraxella osloensis]
MSISRVIKLTVAATALLLLPRRSSLRADKVADCRNSLSAKNTVEQPVNKNTEPNNHNLNNG